MGCHLLHDDIETIGGYLFHLFGTVPEEGARMVIDDMTATVTRLTNRRIRRILIEQGSPEERVP